VLAAVGQLGRPMSAPLVRTATPGIYKRGSRYVVVYKVDGRQRKESARTLADARALKASRKAAGDRGEHVAPTTVKLADYARGWIDRYQGRGKGFRERTRDDYRRDLERYVLPFLGAKRLTALRRADVAAFVAWLVDDQAQAKRHERESAQRRADGQRPLRVPGPLRDRTVARIHAVLSAVLSSAVLDDLRRDNRASRVPLPRRDQLPMPGDDDDAEGQAKALTRAELAAVLLVVHPDWRPFFRLLAATGLRVSEALALDVAHLRLDGSRPVVRVRRAVDRDHMDRPKSDHGVRDVPLPHAVVVELRAHVAKLPPAPAAAQAKWGRLAFPSAAGTPMAPENLRRRVLKPAAEEAGAPWAGFHAFRHAFASLHIERGTNIVRLSRLLGHHKPSFTLDVYAHMLDDGMGQPLDLDAELGSVARPDALAQLVEEAPATAAAAELT
jgi:integrase